jgi:cytochrome oxidase assembly protein ShyY1
MRLIDAQAIGATLPYPVADGYIGLLTVDPPQDGAFTPIDLPEISDGPHFWYAVQWFMFAGIGLAGIVVFIRGDLRERRTGQRKTPKPRKPSDDARPELTSSGV